MGKYTEFKSAQEILSDLYVGNIYGYMIGGFNHRLQGYPERDLANDRQYYELANNMIEKGQIFYVNPFECKCGSIRYSYGGKWACDNCYNAISTPDWWKVMVDKDGDMYCCKGNGFTNLQESENYAFGETKEQALNNYRNIFINPQPK